MEGIVVVFDFDKTIIDCDSDNWVVDELGFTNRFNQLLNSMPWNSMMVRKLTFPFGFPLFLFLNFFKIYFSLKFQDQLMKEMHEEGVTINDMVEVLKRTPIHPRIVPAIKAAHAAGYVKSRAVRYHLSLFRCCLN